MARRTRSQLTTSYRYYRHIIAIKREYERRAEAGVAAPTFAKIAEFTKSHKAENENRARKDQCSLKRYLELHRPQENWKPSAVLLPETWGDYELWLEYRGKFASIAEAERIRAECAELYRTKGGRRALHLWNMAEAEHLRRMILENRQREAPAV